MRLKVIKKFFDFGIYSLAILLAFFLVFERYLELPLLVSWLGHWHPLILHFPIVLILVTIIQYWRNDRDFSWYLSLSTILTLVSAITGLLLSLEGGAKGDLIITHQWLGVSVAYIMGLWYWFSQIPSLPKVYYKVIHSGLVVLIVLTGHYGGMVTHGKEFLDFSFSRSEDITIISENPNIYTNIVQPVLDNKCVSCHNSNKAKGELVLADLTSLMNGGESGSPVDVDNPGKSELLQRIQFPTNHEDHMPPEEEKQLTEAELGIIKGWVEQGAPGELYFSELEDSIPLYDIVQLKIAESKTTTWNHLPEISDSRIAELSSVYCTIRRIYNNTDALQVLVFPHRSYSPELLRDLKPIAENIVELNLSNLPLSSEEFKTISSFSNIEILKMSGTPINDDEFKSIGNLEKLSILKIYNTQLGDGAIDKLTSLDGLRELYIYNTLFTKEGISDLVRRKGGLDVITISDEALEFKSILPPPVVEPEKYFFREPFFVKLKHPLEGINLNYTIDGGLPDINSPVMEDSIFIDKKMVLKYFASKTGWGSSDVDSVLFLGSTRVPDEYELEEKSNLKYGERVNSILFDLEKGPDNFDDDGWMAFRNENFILSCSWNEIIHLESVILSSMIHTDPYIFPPSFIEIRGGIEKDNLTLLATLRPSKLSERQNQHLEYFECKVKSTPVKYVKIIVKSLRKIPMWHQGKGERGWFIIDEVVFQEHTTEYAKQ